MPIFNTKLSTVENNIDYHLKDINWDGQSFGYSLLMINDQERNQFYRDALGDVTDRVVLDIGSGTGLLSVIAVQQGAKKVYAFEYNRRNYELAKSFIEISKSFPMFITLPIVLSAKAILTTASMASRT